MLREDVCKVAHLRILRVEKAAYATGTAPEGSHQEHAIRYRLRAWHRYLAVCAGAREEGDRRREQNLPSTHKKGNVRQVRASEAMEIKA